MKMGCLEVVGSLSGYVELLLGYFEELDEFIKQNYKKLTCEEVRAYYFDLFRRYKAKYGSAEHLSGFSEFLLFRIIFHKLQEEWKISFKRQKNGIFKSEDGWELALNRRFALTKKGRKYFIPDISICYKGNLSFAFEIKTYVTKIKDLEDLINRYKEVYRKQFPCCQLFLVLFQEVKKNSKMEKKIEDEKKNNKWLNVIELHKDQLKDQISEALGKISIPK